jgi:hypothetical protein
LARRKEGRYAVELLPGMTNVVRFPVERRARPTLELLRGIAPDVREVLNLAEAFGVERPVPDLRERVDAATVEHIANQVPAGGAAREAMLCELLEPVVAGAIASCREAHDAWAAAAAAEETLRRARRTVYFRIEPLQERAVALAWRAAELMMIAHMGAEEAEGVARAVGLARSGKAWRPRDVRREAEELFRFAPGAA